MVEFHQASPKEPALGKPSDASPGAEVTPQLAEVLDEEARLRAALAANVVSETMLTGLFVRSGAMDMGIKDGAAFLLAERFADQFLTSGATDYLKVRVTSKALMPGEQLVVSLQRVAGQTPHDLRREAEQRRDQALEPLATSSEDLLRLDWYGEGPKHGDGARVLPDGPAGTWKALHEGQWASGLEFRSAIDIGRELRQPSAAESQRSSAE